MKITYEYINPTIIDLIYDAFEIEKTEEYRDKVSLITHKIYSLVLDGVYVSLNLNGTPEISLMEKIGDTWETKHISQIERLEKNLLKYGYINRELYLRIRLERERF